MRQINMSIVVKRLYVKPNAQLGPCDRCGTTENVWTIATVARRGPGVGWGCTGCGLDFVGATASLCDSCAFEEPKSVWVGAAMHGERKLISELSLDEHIHKSDCPYKHLTGFPIVPGAYVEITDRSKGLPK